MAEAKICTICRSSLQDGRDVLTTSCQHMFHAECIATNANVSNNKCPNCRKPIRSFDDVFTGYGKTSKEKNEKPKSNEDAFSQTMGWVKNKIWPNNYQQPEEDDDNDSEGYQQVEFLTPCRDSIYCFDQYSQEKSLNHNQTYSHPCSFSELCHNIHSISHCIQYTHNKHDVPKCRQDTNCKQVTDPIHRYSYRHTDLSDILYPCRYKEGCRDKSFEHRKKYFHGEHINLPPILKKVAKGKKTPQTRHPASSHNAFQPRFPQTTRSARPPNSFQSPNMHPTESHNTVKQTKFQNSSHTTTSSYAFDEHSSNIWSPKEVESDEEDLVSSFYNDDAGKSNIPNAGSYDQYGNPTARKYDLGKDGAYVEFSILIAQFFIDSRFNDAAMQKPIDALKVKGFQVKHVKTENECITELASNRHQIAWIISTDRIQNPSFIPALTTFHSSGGAIFLFADNTPYVCHASEFLKGKFGITVKGDYYADKTLTYKENSHQQAGHFGQHEIFTGITNLYEGITICHPVYSTPASRTVFVTIATATDGNSCIAVHDSPSTSTEGRLCLDCGFTKLFRNWDAAGTARYIVNASCWLLGIEKRLKSKKKNKKK